MFVNVKGESRASKESVCDRNNAGVAVVIRRLNNIMIPLMSISYKDVFAVFITLITKDDEAVKFGGNQIAYNFDFALAKVSNSIHSVIPMKLGDGSEYSTREVAKAIIATMTYQVGQMRLRELMRNQKEDFVELLARQLERSQGGSSEKPSSREVAQGSTIEYQDIIKQSQWPEEKKGCKGGSKGDKKENTKTDKKVPTKSTYLCVAYLGESLDAKVGEQLSRCPKGEAKCIDGSE
jgi:hypothetical protein